mmetsp:Transcript_7812/g.20283  ORF Transcript_7812/g.20283 Transcript_7812/m.20283 type:complete len:80 (-) Transcript_7812:173-412(-)
MKRRRMAEKMRLRTAWQTGFKYCSSFHLEVTSNANITQDAAKLSALRMIVTSAEYFQYSAPHNLLQERCVRWGVGVGEE